MLRIRILVSLIFVVILSSYGKVQWEELDCGIRNTMVMEILSDGEYQYASTINGFNLYRRKIGDRSWEKILRIEDETTPYHFNIKKIMGKLLCFWHQHEFVYSDSLDEWVDTSYSMDANIVQDESNLIRIYFDNVQMSIDSGTTWDNVLSNDENLSSIYSCSSGTYVGGWGQIYHSKDNGKSWSVLSNGLPSRCAIRNIINAEDSVLIVSTDNGVYLSHNLGNNWSLIDDDFSDAQQKVLENFCLYNNTLYALDRYNLYRFTSDYDSIVEVNIPYFEGYKKTDLDVFNGKLSVAGYNGVFLYSDIDSSWEIIGEGLEKEKRVEDFWLNDNYLFVGTEDMLGRKIILRNDLQTDVWDSLFEVNADQFSSYYNVWYNYVRIGSFYSSDYGKTLDEDTVVSQLLQGSKYEYRCFEDTLYSQKDSLLIMSSDKGSTWDTVVINTDNQMIFKVGKRMFFLEHHTVSKPHVKPYSYTTIHYSEDLGITISDSIVGLKNTGSFAMSEQGVLLAECGYSTGISLDSGKTWCFNESDTPINRLLNFKDDFLLARKNGINYPSYNYAKDIVFSLDQGITWHTVDHPETGETFGSLWKFDYCYLKDSILYVCSDREKRLFRTTINELVKDIPVANTINSNSMILKKFNVCVNGNTINVNLNTPINSNYEIKIFNASGREIKGLMVFYLLVNEG